jgi:hypothetical protein
MLIAIPTPHTIIRCLICSSADKPSVIPNLCLQCYATGAFWAGHHHDVSFYACDSDPTLTGAQLPQHTWIVRRNVSKRLWYEHRQTRYKTHMRPMTAACGLPSGWQQRKDPEGNIYYENTLTRQSSRTIPRGLPPGWREAKDPDGKLFFVHDELQLASWYRPGEQPPGRRPDSVGTATTSNFAGNASNVSVKHPKPDAVTKPAQAIAKPSTVAAKHNRASPAVTVKLPSSQQVNLQTATEATINLIDPSEGGIVRGTKIAAHLAGRGVKSTVKAVKSSQRLQGFARGTGIATANRQVKKTWRKAAREVDARNGQEVTIRQSGSQGQDIILEEVDDGYNGEYVVEYDDGMVECYSADGQFQHTVERQDISGARPSQLVGARQGITRQQQYQNRQQQYQNTQQQVYLPSSTDLACGAGPEESVFVNRVESQVPYASQEQNTYIDQNQDVFVLPSQDISVEQSLPIYQGAEEFGVEQKLQVEYDQSMTQEIEIEGEGVDVIGDFDAGSDLDAFFNI